jgi:lipopolysaccharide export system protein LptC
VERFTTAFPLVLVAMLAALSYWLAYIVQAPAPARDGSARHDPDYIVENFTATRMGPDGLRLHQLEAQRMQHYPDDDSTHLDSPRLLQYDGERLALSITATDARVSSEGKTVDFNGDVKAVRYATPARSELTLTTDFLHVVPDDDFASTDRPVTILDANTKVTAVGLELNNKAQILKLMSNVRGSYVQKKK